MCFDSSFLISELCPWKSCKTQRNSCRIKSILLSWYIQNAGFSLFASFLHHIASEVFHVSVAIILAYVVVELSSIQKCCKLSENIFVLKHSSQFFLAAKLQNQVRFIAKYCIKDYNSTVSKIELPFFIGQ